MRKVIFATKAGSSFLSLLCCERVLYEVCGIVGYVGFRNAAEVLLDGLRRVEYRGYDSAGLAVRTEKGLEIVKEVGKVSDLEEAARGRNLTGCQGIGHTRWATHGGVTVTNAHPHADGAGRFALVHNGIIENYLDLQEELHSQGVCFFSQTDTEVIVQLLARLRAETDDMPAALTLLQQRLNGSFALAIIDAQEPECFYCVRRGSPLVLGVGVGECFCASDVSALLPYTKNVVYLEEGDTARVCTKGVEIWNECGEEVCREIAIVDWDVSMSEKDGYPHYMLKEINEQGAVFRSTLKGRITEGRIDLSNDLAWDISKVNSWKNLHIVACGTSYYASLVAQRALEQWTDFHVVVDVASEYRYRRMRADAGTLAVFVSQSGETADTLAAQRKARSEGAHCLAITNVRGSTLAREVHDVLLLKAGPEIGVAATKTFMGQMAALYLLALFLGETRGTLPVAEAKRLVEELLHLPYKVETVLNRQDAIKETARKYAEKRNFLYLGRGNTYPVALEGALKLKEISYIHAEAYAAGEMKHGPIALLEPDVPVFVVVPRNSLYEKTLSNIQEAKARHSAIIAVGTDGDTLLPHHAEDILWIPWTDEEFVPFLAVVPLQLFAYHAAVLRGCEIDQPRNLAKSVTVE
jgi:glucosamine--fructose-6-phosphate aminotransferase (isomerizing)